MPYTGQIRENPATRQMEIFTSDGIWSSTALGKQMGSIQSQLPSIQQGIRNLNIQSSEPIDLNYQTSQTAQNAGTMAQEASSPYLRFMEQLRNIMLQSQQGVVPQITGLQGQQLGLEEQRAKAGLTTPQDLIGASPELQAGVRGAEMEQFTPGIKRAEEAGKSLTSRLNQFESLLKYAKEFGSEFAKVSPTPEILDSYREGLKTGKLKVSDIPDEVRPQVISKMTKDDWALVETGIKRDTSITEIGGRKILIDNQTGETIKDLGEITSTDTEPLSGEASKIYSIATTVIPEIEQLKEEFRKDYKGALRGIISGTDRRLVKLVDNIADKVGRLRSGGAINKDEEARFKRQIASWRDILFGNQEDAITALDGIITEANSVSQSMNPQGTQQGIKIPVLERLTGNTGWIYENEFDPEIYIKLKQ